MNIKPTLKEISSMTNLSISTISRAMKNPGLVKKETRRKIEAALSSYQNEKASSGLIGLVLPEIYNEFFLLMLAGIDKAINPEEQTILLCHSSGKEKEENAIINKLLDINVDGIIFIPSSMNIPSALIEVLSSSIVPVIFLDRNPGLEDVCLVTSNNYEGMFQAATYLLTLGHRKILYIGGNDTSTSKEREKAFLDAMKAYSLIPEEKDMVTANYRNDKAYSIVDSLCKSGNFEYTAICASNDIMALGAIKALSDNKLKVPDDVSVIGFDDIPSANLMGLTTIRQPFMAMGMNAMYELNNAIKNPYAKGNVIELAPNIVFRSSCKMHYKA